MEESISISIVLSCLLERARVEVKCRETQMNISVHVAYTKIPLCCSKSHVLRTTSITFKEKTGLRFCIRGDIWREVSWLCHRVASALCRNCSLKSKH